MLKSPLPELAYLISQDGLGNVLKREFEPSFKPKPERLVSKVTMIFYKKIWYLKVPNANLKSTNKNYFFYK